VSSVGWWWIDAPELGPAAVELTSQGLIWRYDDVRGCLLAGGLFLPEPGSRLLDAHDEAVPDDEFSTVVNLDTRPGLERLRADMRTLLVEAADGSVLDSFERASLELDDHAHDDASVRIVGLRSLPNGDTNIEISWSLYYGPANRNYEDEVVHQLVWQASTGTLLHRSERVTGSRERTTRMFTEAFHDGRVPSWAGEMPLPDDDTTCPYPNLEWLAQARTREEIVEREQHVARESVEARHRIAEGTELVQQSRTERTVDHFVWVPDPHCGFRVYESHQDFAWRLERSDGSQRVLTENHPDQPTTRIERVRLFPQT
jgi:hypothetical protein